MFKFKINLLFISIFIFSACNTIYRGYNIKDIANKDFTIGTTKKSEILSIFGQETFKNNIDDSYCYMSSIGKRFLFIRYGSAKYHIICYKFKNDVLFEIFEKKDFNFNNFKSYEPELSAKFKPKN